MNALESLIGGLRDVCAGLPDRRKSPSDAIYSMADIGLSAFSLFCMGSPSFLAHQRRLEEGHGRSNCQTLFGMSAIPSDACIRLMLDGAPPTAFDPLFFQAIGTEGVLTPFHRLDGRVLIALDGTEHFCSRTIHCSRCSTRKRSDGGTEYFHAFLGATLVAPGHQQVLPLPPEFIAPQDGAEKQDCERNAAKRWLERHGPAVAPLRPVFLGDDLFACQPIVSMLTQAGDDFIFTCKQTSHKALYDFIDGAEPERHVETIRKGKAVETRRYRWIEGVPLRDGRDAALVNWVACEIIDRHGAVKYSVAWVTSLPVGKASVADIAACGRSRWKIENETFNVMKNHGYELEHNFGHGEKFLAMTLAALNLLAFAWHSALDIVDPPWQTARQVAAKRASFFAHLLTLTSYVVFPSWSALLQALTTFTIPPELLQTQKIE